MNGRPPDPFAETMTVAQAIRLLEDKGSTSDPIFHGAGGDSIDASDLLDRVDGDEKAADVRIRYYGGTTLTAAHVVLCEGSIRDMVLERHGREPGKAAETCAVCGDRSDFPGADRCANCWEVERRLVSYLQTVGGREFARAAIAEAEAAALTEARRKAAATRKPGARHPAGRR